MARRTFLAQLAGLPFLALGGKTDEPKKPLKIMMKSAWDPMTQPGRPFPLRMDWCSPTLATRCRSFFWPRRPLCYENRWSTPSIRWAGRR